jgi:acetate kinase
MIVLTVNSGSSSIKLAAYDVSRSGDRKRLAGCRQPAEGHSGEPLDEPGIIRRFLATLQQPPNAIAHRVVHGGTRFTQPTRIDDSVVRQIEGLSELAPLHNPKALRWIAAARSVCGPDVVQVAAFDTAYFASLPRVAAEYALPPRLGTDEGVRRYGFHGLAHEALWRRWRELNANPAKPADRVAGTAADRDPPPARLITLQLGGGCSIAAIAGGRPLDTSMGFSPLEGLVMATRSGDIDAAVVPYLQHRLGISAEQVIAQLNHEAGIAGLSGSTGDFTELLGREDAAARFAFDLYCYRARKYVGAYLAVLGGCDGIAFGGGVGEHAPAVRARILEGLEWAGIEVDPEANERGRGEETLISPPGSHIKVHVIPVDEDQVLLDAAVAAT